jgi:hypothetical protein
MAALTVPFGLTLRDARGFTGKVRFYITGDDGTPDDILNVADIIADAVEGLSNGRLVSTTGLDLTNVSPLVYGLTAQYLPAWLKAAMTFADANGGTHTFEIPSPLVGIFDTDLTTVLNDGTIASVVTFKTAITTASGTAFCSTRGGIAYALFVGGNLLARKQPKRFTRKIKSSHLVQGEGE